MALRAANPVDLAAAVAGAEAVVARSGALMALAWALGTAHVAVAGEDTPASNFAAWTGDASALAQDGAAIVAGLDNIFARRGRPRGSNDWRLRSTSPSTTLLTIWSRRWVRPGRWDRGGHVRAALVPGGLAGRQELEAVNEALRQRLAVERLRFGERSALLERAANTSVESAIKAVHGQDVIVRRRLEQTEKEMKRLQEETALQQAELRAIHASLTMRAFAPARAWYEGGPGDGALSVIGQVGHPQGRSGRHAAATSSVVGWPAQQLQPAPGRPWSYWRQATKGPCRRRLSSSCCRAPSGSAP